MRLRLVWLWSAFFAFATPSFASLEFTIFAAFCTLTLASVFVHSHSRWAFYFFTVALAIAEVKEFWRMAILNMFAYRNTGTLVLIENVL